MTKAPQIRREQLRIVRRILHEHLPDGVRVWVFGSRARADNRTWSDLDLALEGPEALREDSLIALEEAFERSDLSLRVDLVDLHQVTDRFRRLVEAERKLLPG